MRKSKPGDICTQNAQYGCDVEKSQLLLLIYVFVTGSKINVFIV